MYFISVNIVATYVASAHSMVMYISLKTKI